MPLALQGKVSLDGECSHCCQQAGKVLHGGLEPRQWGAAVHASPPAQLARVPGLAVHEAESLQAGEETSTQELGSEEGRAVPSGPPGWEAWPCGLGLWL